MATKKTSKPEAAPAKPAKAAPKAKAAAPAKAAAAKPAPAKGKAAKAAAPARKPLTQSALIDRLASKSGATKTHVKAILDELAATAGTEIGAGFTIPGVGKLSVRTTKERQGRNPATGAAMTIPAGKRVKFSVAAALKRSVE